VAKHLTYGNVCLLFCVLKQQLQSADLPETEDSDDEFVKLVNDGHLLSGQHCSHVCVAFVAESLFLKGIT